MLKRQKQISAASAAVNIYENELKDRLMGAELTVDDALEMVEMLSLRLSKLKSRLADERMLVSDATRKMERLLHAETRDSHAHPLAIEKAYGKAFERHIKSEHRVGRLSELTAELSSQVESLEFAFSAIGKRLDSVAKNVNVVASE